MKILRPRGAVTENSVPSPQEITRRGPNRRLRRLSSLLLLLAVVVVFTGCVEARTAATQSWSGVAVDGDDVYVGTHSARIIQLDANTGTARAAPFRAPEVNGAGFPAFYGTPTVADGLVYAGGYHGVVYTLRTGTLVSVGSREVDGNPLTKGIAGSVIPVGDVLVVGAAEDTGAGRIYVLERDTLVEVCRYPARGQEPIGQIWSTPTVVDGIIYVGSMDHQLHAVRLEDCTAAWQSSADLHGAVVAPPYSMGDKLYVGTFDRRFYEVDKGTGNAEELFRANSWFWGGVASDGQRLFIPNLDGKLYAYDVEQRRLAWTFEPRDADRTPMVATPAVYGDRVIAGSDDGIIYVLRTADGGLEWDLRVPGGHEIRAPLTVSDSTLFVHTTGGVLSAINLETRRTLWDRRLEDVQ